MTRKKHIRFRSQSEIDQMLEKLEKARPYSEAQLTDIEQRITAIKYVTELHKQDVIDLSDSRSSGYPERAADWLIFRQDDSKMMCGLPGLDR